MEPSERLRLERQAFWLWALPVLLVCASVIGAMGRYGPWPIIFWVVPVALSLAVVRPANFWPPFAATFLAQMVGLLAYHPFLWEEEPEALVIVGLISAVTAAIVGAVARWRFRA